MQTSGSIKIISVTNGATLNAILAVYGSPLVQSYTPGTDSYVPDFKQMADNGKPTVVPLVRNSTDGKILSPVSLAWKYNGVELGFGSDGLCVSPETMAGRLMKLSSYSVEIEGTSYQLPALRVVDNLVPVSGYDNDLISVSGMVEMGGASITFADLGKTVVIQESTGNVYGMSIASDTAFAILSANGKTTLKATVYNAGNPMNPGDSGVTFKWYKVLVSGDVQLTPTSDTCAILQADVDNVLTVRCEAWQAGTRLVSESCQITDFSDPVMTRFDVTGIDGLNISEGQTAIVTPVAYRRGTGEEVTVSNWSFRTIDNEGADFIPTGQSSATFSGKSVSLPYADVRRAHGGVSIYAEC